MKRVNNCASLFVQLSGLFNSMRSAKRLWTLKSQAKIHPVMLAQNHRGQVGLISRKVILEVLQHHLHGLQVEERVVRHFQGPRTIDLLSSVYVELNYKCSWIVRRHILRWDQTCEYLSLFIRLVITPRVIYITFHPVLEQGLLSRTSYCLVQDCWCLSTWISQQSYRPTYNGASCRDAEHLLRA